MGILGILSKTAAEHGRNFLVIGGYAVNAHGYARQTADLDILVVKADRDFWKEVLLKNGYTIFSEHENFAQWTPPVIGQLPVDFMFVNEQTFFKMYPEAVEGILIGVKIKYPSLMHLLALKMHVIKQALPHRELKDLYDVIQLVQINRVDTQSQSFKELCEKFGNAKIYETLVRASK